MKKIMIGLLTMSVLCSLSFVLFASNVPEGAPPNAIMPQAGGCPLNYDVITYNMGFVSIDLCVPTGSYSSTPAPDFSQAPPPPNPPGQSITSNPPVLGSPPAAPSNPEGFSPPRGEKNRALQETPKGLSNSLRAVAWNNLYFYYQGRYTQRAATYLGRWIPVYVNLPRGGNLKVLEHYYRSGRQYWHHWGYRPAGWTKFWFYADTRGWHALISQTNGGWGNWIWVYVY